MWVTYFPQDFPQDVGFLPQPMLFVGEGVHVCVCMCMCVWIYPQVVVLSVYKEHSLTHWEHICSQGTVNSANEARTIQCLIDCLSMSQTPVHHDLLTVGTHSSRTGSIETTLSSLKVKEFTAHSSSSVQRYPLLKLHLYAPWK